MRTTRDENRAIGEWIGARLNLMEGPVRFLLPEGGVSMLDAPGEPFHDPEADAALFEAIEKTVRPATQAPVERVQGKHQRSVVFEAVVEAFRSISPPLRTRLSMIRKSGSRFSERSCSSRTLKTLRLNDNTGSNRAAARPAE